MSSTNIDMQLAAYQFPVAILVGIGAAGSMGVTALVGIAMSATAFSATCLVIKKLEEFDYDADILTTVGNITLISSWVCTVTQISQLFVQYVLLTSVPFFPSLFITGSSLLIGAQLLGTLLHNMVVGETN